MADKIYADYIQFKKDGDKYYFHDDTVAGQIQEALKGSAEAGELGYNQETKYVILRSIKTIPKGVSEIITTAFSIQLQFKPVGYAYVKWKIEAPNRNDLYIIGGDYVDIMSGGNNQSYTRSLHLVVYNAGEVFEDSSTNHANIAGTFTYQYRKEATK